MFRAKKCPKKIWIIVGLAVITLVVGSILYYMYILTPSVTGSVDYGQSTVLPQGSKLVIQLRDTTYQDASSELIAEEVIVNPAQSPVKFKLDYKPADIKEDSLYSMNVRIFDNDGRLLFINDTSFEVITDGNPSRLNIPLVEVQ